MPLVVIERDLPTPGGRLISAPQQLGCPRILVRVDDGRAHAAAGQEAETEVGVIVVAVVVVFADERVGVDEGAGLHPTLGREAVTAEAQRAVVGFGDDARPDAPVAEVARLHS